MTTGITDTGFVIKTLAEILTGIEDAEKAAYGDALDVTATSVLGQLNGINSEKLSELWELGQAVYSAFDPDAASGSSLENVAALCPGITRLAATKSTVSASCNLDNGTYAAGALIAHVDGDATARFVNTLEVVQAAGPGVVAVAMEGETAGAVVAAITTLTEIAEPVSGWNSVTNAAAADAGREVETDAELRYRREQQIALAGGSSVMGIRADVLNLDDVDKCNVEENDTDATVGILPPHSFRVIYLPTSDAVLVDADVAVGQVIHDSKPAGIATAGSLDEDYDDSGATITIYFDRFTEVDLYFDLEIENYADLTDSQKETIENAVINSIGSFSTVYKNTVVGAVVAVLDDFNGTTAISEDDAFRLASLKMDTHDTPDDNDSVTAGIDEVFATDAAKIDLAAP